ncbi:restriction endonuclease subunit S [Benzoatithermus flavus]|uniref:Restriction endonuclease subunit S n=1 Tax=Benzoatithermus flavus TaxID=3108223 RepID=A0ABU8XX77_9PROT
MSAATNFPVEWQQVSLRELHAGGVGSLDPRNFPEERFEYYSIPAYQEAAKPLVVSGRDIQSQKLLIPHSCLLFGKLNPRVEKVWNVKSKAPLRRLASTEWMPIVPVEKLDQDFGYYLLRSEWVMPIAKGLVSGSTPSRERVEPKAFYDISVPLPPRAEQESIAGVLSLLDRSIHKQSELLKELANLKRAAMRELFTRGLRGEPQKDTEIGPVPESWEIARLDSVASVRAGTSFPPALQGKNHGDLPFYKVSDMNLADNEVEMHAATNWIDRTELDDLRAKPFPPETIIFPKVGGALHTNKKRLLTVESLVDNNIMGVTVLDREYCLPKYLFGWFQTINLSSIANAGPLPSINSSQLYELKVPIPSVEDQREIVTILDAIDRKIALHRQKRAVLEELFKALLHKLMTGEIRVADLDLSAVESHHAPHQAA